MTGGGPVAVVGAGIAGLAAAFELAERGREVLVFERTTRAGGNLRTERDGGFVVEHGPNGFLDDAPATLDLVKRLGLEAELLVSSDAARIRYLWRRGALRPLPASPPAFLCSPVLTPLGRARVLLEPFARRGPRRGDESVHAFAARRIGREAADVLVQSLVSGVFAGDARRLSLRAAFPKLHALEARHGGLFRGMLAKRREGGGGPAGPRGRLTSFRRGIEALPERLGERLGERVRLGAPVEALAPLPGGGWRLAPDERSFESVVLAGPAAETAALVEPFAPTAAAALRRIPSAPLAVVAAAYPEAAIGGPPPGFGFLAPRGEGLRILGGLWDSSIYPGARAPAGFVLLRAMVGGALDPAAAELPNEALRAIVRRDLRTSMGIAVEPARWWIFRHRRGIPQYTEGHLARVAAAEAALAARPGLFLAGNAIRGVSMNAVIADAVRIAGLLGRPA